MFEWKMTDVGRTTLTKAVCFSLLASVSTVAQADDVKQRRGRPFLRGPVVLSSRIEMLDDSIALDPPVVSPTVPKVPADKPASKGSATPGALIDRVREFGRTAGIQKSDAVQAERLEPQSSKRSSGISKVSLFSLFSGPNGEELEDPPANPDEPIPPAPTFDIIEDRPLPQPIPSVDSQVEMPYSFPPLENNPQYYGATEGGDEACTTENGRAISGVMPQSDKKWCVLRWPGLSRMFKK